LRTRHFHCELLNSFA